MPETMLAVVKPEAAPGADVRQMPIPQYGPDDVLVKVKVASVCGTDLHIYNWDQWAQNRIKPPLIPGHEFCGHVVTTGKNVTAVKEGDFVSAEMHVACGKCYQCRTGEAHICQHVKIIGVDANGAFAEFVKIPESNIWKIDPGVGVIFSSRPLSAKKPFSWPTQSGQLKPPGKTMTWRVVAAHACDAARAMEAMASRAARMVIAP